MTSNAALNWLDGRGWLVLAGDVPASDSVRAHALGVAAADGGIAVIAIHGADADAEQLLADFEDLGAGAGFLVDLVADDDITLHDRLAEASVVIISDAGAATDVHSALYGAAVEGIQNAFENGAVVLVEGAGAMSFGTWMTLDDSGDVVTGLDWLRGAFVLPGTNQVADTSAAKMILTAQPHALAIGIGPGSALALGPDGQVEPWGQQQVTIALGPDFGA